MVENESRPNQGSRPQESPCTTLAHPEQVVVEPLVEPLHGEEAVPAVEGGRRAVRVVLRKFGQNANQNAKNLGSVAPVGSKIAPIMLEIKFYII